MKSNYKMGLCFEGFAELWKGFSKNFLQTKPGNINERRYKNSDASTSSLLNTAERSSLLLRGFLLCCNMSLEHPQEGPQGTFPLYKFMRNYQDPFV